MYELGLNIDYTGKDAEFYTPLYIASVIDLNVEKVMVLIEYGAQLVNISNLVMEQKAQHICHTVREKIRIKWEVYSRKACTVLMMRKRQSSFFHVVGHDMTRLVAQEIWKSRR